MRKILISAAAVAALAVAAAPASAQRGYGYGYGYSQGPTRSVQIENQLQQIRDRIRRAEQRDLISRREAGRLLDRLGDIAQRYDRYRRNGLSRDEHHELHSRLQDLRERLREERREGRYDDRYDDRRRGW
jgi:hypothetical protein